MFKGIIYKYTSPSGKCYIGLTINELKRKRTFQNLNMRYAGGKIDLARNKYGPENFVYKIEKEIETATKEELIRELNKYETYYVSKYNSFENGYNSTPGGDGGHKFTEEEKEKISDILAFPVVQYDIDGNFIKIWKSCREIEKVLNFTRIPIQNCCRGNNYHSYGFIWRYYDSNNFDFLILGIKVIQEKKAYY